MKYWQEKARAVWRQKKGIYIEKNLWIMKIKIIGVFSSCSHLLQHTCNGKTKYFSPVRWINIILISKMWRVGLRSTSQWSQGWLLWKSQGTNVERCPVIAPQAGIIRWLQDEISFAQNHEIWWELASLHMILKTHSTGKETIPTGSCSRVLRQLSSYLQAWRQQTPL